MADLRPFFPYFGSKWRSVPHYPAPRYGTIVEPFAGAAGYSVRHHDAAIVLNDLDPAIVDVWRYLIDATADEVMALPLIDEFETTDELDVASGARFLMGFWLGPGSATPNHRPSTWVRRYVATHPGSVWSERTRERVASQVDSIRHWRVGLGSYNQLNDIEASWFVDPPYQGAGRHYRHGSAGLDHEHLATWCRARRGQVIACENDGATWLPFRFLTTIQGAAGKQRTGVSHEAVWLAECGSGRCIEDAA